MMVLGIHRLIDNRSWNFFGHHINQEKVFQLTNMIVSAFVIFDSYIVILNILPNGYFGS